MAPPFPCRGRSAVGGICLNFFLDCQEFGNPSGKKLASDVCKSPLERTHHDVGIVSDKAGLREMLREIVFSGISGVAETRRSSFGVPYKPLGRLVGIERFDAHNRL